MQTEERATAMKTTGFTKRPGRLPARGLGIALLLAMPPLHALELGLFRVDSGLDEPFRGRIELDLSEGENTTVGGLSAQLADPKAFVQAGLPYPRMLDGLRFRLSREGGAPHVRVTSTQPISDPYLSLIVEARLGENRKQRHYTVFLDPPVHARRPALNLQTAAATATTTDTARAAPPPPPSPSVPVYGPVRPAETLWSIANKLRPNQGVSTQQMTLGLHRTNLDAFKDGRINGLRSGSMLRVPPLEELRAIGVRDAFLELRRLNAIAVGDAETKQTRASTKPPVTDRAAGNAATPETSTNEPAPPQQENSPLRKPIAALEWDLDDTRHRSAQASAATPKAEKDASPIPATASNEPQRPNDLAVEKTPSEATQPQRPVVVADGAPTATPRPPAAVAPPQTTNTAAVPQEPSARAANSEPAVSEPLPWFEAWLRNLQARLPILKDDPVIMMTVVGLVALLLLLIVVAFSRRKSSRAKRRASDRRNIAAANRKGVRFAAPLPVAQPQWLDTPEEPFPDAPPPKDTTPQSEPPRKPKDENTDVEALEMDLDDLGVEAGQPQTPENGAANLGGDKDDAIDLDADLGIDSDEFSVDDTPTSKLDLAKTYIDLGDMEGARTMLDEVLTEGADDQKREAEQLLAQLD